MVSRGFQRVWEDVQAWLGLSGDEYRAFVRRGRLRQWGLAVLVVAVLVGSGVAGYAIGASQGGDSDAAWQAGTAAGEQRGAATGTHAGYASAFKAAREQAYDAAYRESYRAAYVGAFERADLAAPSRVKVSGP